MFEAYVYKITNKITKEFYIGFRFKNKSLKLNPEEDLWIIYFTSSEYVKKQIEEYGKDSFEYEFLFRDIDEELCFIEEQKTISENISNPLCLNKMYFQDVENMNIKFYCGGHSEETKLKISEMLNSEEVKQKMKNTFMEKYGVDHNSKIPGISSKRKNKEKKTLLDKYGVDHNMKIPEVLSKMIDSRDKTMVEKYGVINALQVPEISKKQQENQTKYWQENFGVENPLQIPDILKKQQETNKKVMMKKYGVSNVSQLKTKCPHCGRVGSLGNMTRWHFDNCKMKGNDNE